MPFTPDYGLIEDRRRHVAAMKIRGLTTREISLGLEQLGCVNPNTGERWSHETVAKDIEALREQWKKEAHEDFSTHLSNVVAELREVRRAGWKNGNLGAVLASIDRECKLLGLNSPIKFEGLGGGKDAGSELRLNLDKMSNDELGAVLKIFGESLGEGGDPAAYSGQAAESAAGDALGSGPPAV